MAVQIGMSWHDGELRIQNKLGGAGIDNPTNPSLSQQGALLLQQAPLLAVGTLDDQGRPWTTLWGGQPGFGMPLGASMVGIKTAVDDQHDPVIQTLCGGAGQAGQQDGVQGMAGKLMSALIIDLDRRKRVKIVGRAVAGAVAVPENVREEKPQAQIQLVVRIDQSLGQCPKYINRKNITPSQPHSELVSDSALLGDRAKRLVSKADIFFISSSHADNDMDTNNRGGPAGFVRVSEDEDGKSIIVWPEYSGNRLYQTLGNLETTPLAGLVVPDFDSGDVLYVTGNTETLIGKAANSIIPRSNLAIKLTVTGAKLVQQGLPLRGEAIEPSPYNPRVRPLASETQFSFGEDKGASNSAKFLEQTVITPTITRFKLSMNNPASYKAGQWVALDFSEEMDMGYSHMRDDDPTSLNDDFVRTFTVSSPPPPRGDLTDDNFEITVRRVGRVTGFMSRLNVRTGLEVPMRGFGGDFTLHQKGHETIPFIAGGVGITAVLPFLPELEMSRFRLFWTLHIDDINLVSDTIKRHSPLASALEIFLTGVNDLEAANTASIFITEAGAKVNYRRLNKVDIQRPELGNTWHICVGTGLRKTLVEWLEGKEVVFEDFNF